MAGKSRGLPDVGRAKRRQVLRSTVVIWCEGESEQGYFEALIAELGIGGAVRLNPHGCGSHPKNLISAAKKDAITGGADTVWLVFDFDGRKDFKACCAAANKASFQTAWSDFCFEYWLLLHYRFTTAGHGSADAAEAALKKEMPTYCKGSDSRMWDQFIGLRATAVANAKKAYDSLATMAADKCFPTPATTVYKLIEALEMLAPTTGKR